MHDLIHDIGNCVFFFFLFVSFSWLHRAIMHFMTSVFLTSSLSDDKSICFSCLVFLGTFGGYSLSILNSVDAQLSMMCQVLNCVRILTA